MKLLDQVVQRKSHLEDADIAGIPEILLPSQFAGLPMDQVDKADSTLCRLHNDALKG